MLKNLFGLLGISGNSVFVDEDKPSQEQKNNRVPFISRGRASKPSTEQKDRTLASAYREGLSGSVVAKAARGSAAIDNLDLIIESAYQQVFGNIRLMESERLGEAESQLRGGKITVKEFVRILAKSARYQALFWDKYPNVTVIELNFKHFLGRAPASYQEISEHIQILAAGGFDAEIDAYFDSDEYSQAFGNDQVPYLKGYDSSVGGNTAGFMSAFPLFGTACSSESSLFSDGLPKLQATLVKGTASEIPAINVLPEPSPLLSLELAKPGSFKPQFSTSEGQLAKDESVEDLPSAPQIQVFSYPEDQAKPLAEKYRDALVGNPIVEFTKDSISIENLDLVIEAAYKQVFGNAHLMESERLREAESQMREGQINVSDFIRRLAQSDLYRSLFWDKYPNVTVIELNFKHLLGRPPKDYEEVSQHVKILAEGGLEAEIDSYIDSDEYFQAFGNDQVPYLRGYTSQTGGNAVSFTHSFPLFGTACSSDKSNIGTAVPKLQTRLIQKSSSTIPPLRAIPESFPEALTIGPEPRIPLEIRGMARELWLKVEARRSLVLFP